MRMTYTTTLTSKGQMTLPIAFRRKLKLKAGERVLVKMRGNEVIILKDNWLENLQKLQRENQLFLKKHRIKPLTNEELDRAIDDAAEEAAAERYKRSLE